MTKPNALVLTGYGINCDEETAFALREAGARADIMHVNDLIAAPGTLDRYQMLLFPGGFSYGDDTGSGKALANRIRNNCMDEVQRFVQRDTLTLGICNGFQVMVALGLVPNRDGSFATEVALQHNTTFRYQCRWVDLAVNEASPAVFTRGLTTLHVPVAHGEGNFFAPAALMQDLKNGGSIALRYARPDGSPANGEFPYNPNGAMDDVAAVCDRTGRVMGMMPHPERAIHFTQRDDWTRLRDEMVRRGERPPIAGDGFRIFQNAVDYFS